MNNPGLIKSFNAPAAILATRIVKFGASDTDAAQAAAATDALIGVSVALVPALAGERIDIVMTGVTEVEYGGAVTRGDLLTADASGRAIVAAINQNVIGMAMVSGVLGDIGSVLLSQSKLSNV